MTKINDNHTSGNEEWISSLNSEKLKKKLQLLMSKGGDKKQISYGLFRIIDAKMNEVLFQRALEKHKTRNPRNRQQNKE